jgi:hypothetical protein
MSIEKMHQTITEIFTESEESSPQTHITFLDASIYYPSPLHAYVPSDLCLQVFDRKS